MVYIISVPCSFSLGDFSIRSYIYFILLPLTRVQDPGPPLGEDWPEDLFFTGPMANWIAIPTDPVPVAHWHKCVCVCDGHFTWHWIRCSWRPTWPSLFLDMGRSAEEVWHLTKIQFVRLSNLYVIQCAQVIKVEMSQQDTISGQQNYPWSETGHNQKPVKIILFLKKFRMLQNGLFSCP